MKPPGEAVCRMKAAEDHPVLCPQPLGQGLGIRGFNKFSDESQPLNIWNFCNISSLSVGGSICELLLAKDSHHAKIYFLNRRSNIGFEYFISKCYDYRRKYSSIVFSPITPPPQTSDISQIRTVSVPPLPRQSFLQLTSNVTGHK